MGVSTATGNLAARIAQHRVSPGSVAAWWLGGSGFVFKTPAGAQVYLDPYLSDVVSAIFGMGRAFPTPIQSEEAHPDVIISTHWHEDHLDPEAIPIIARNNPSTRFIMPPSAMARALSWGVPRDRITPLSAGETVEVSDMRVSHVPARHEAGVVGWEVPDAMGVILEVAGLKIYNSGDTEYDVRLRLLKSHHFDVAIVCINGVGGNMNAREAALLVYEQGAKTVIPVHHLLWAENRAGDEATLDPRLFEETYRKLGGTGRVILPEVGGEIRFAA
jgi:L-ascorbate metabolism protein UlaG (beta-lactamase superfamily)